MIMGRGTGELSGESSLHRNSTRFSIKRHGCGFPCYYWSFWERAGVQSRKHTQYEIRTCTPKNLCFPFATWQGSVTNLGGEPAIPHASFPHSGSLYASFILFPQCWLLTLQCSKWVLKQVSQTSNYGISHASCGLSIPPVLSCKLHDCFQKQTSCSK